MRRARPERFRIALRDQQGGTPLPLPSRRMWPAGIFFGVAFVIFAGIAWNQIYSIRSHEVKNVFDLAFILFQGFWVLGWSVGVVILGALPALFFFYGETAVIVGARLIHSPRLGPLRLQSEYDLAKIRNLRLERAEGRRKESAQIWFDYGGGRTPLGDAMERAEAERILALIRDAAALLSGGETNKVAEQREPEPPPARTPVRAKPTPARNVARGLAALYAATDGSASEAADV